MNDTLHYMQTDFPWRPGNYRMLTFSSMYQFNENFILPLSHDEVVNGKCSLITRMPGDYWRQFAGMRALAFYQMTHPGGKLNFMGNEIAQFIEWRYYEGIQYFLSHPTLWQRAFESDGFEWIDADNADQSIISFIRRGDDPKEDLVILINFDVNAREDFRMGVPEWGVYEEVFNTDNERFGGSGVLNAGKLKCQDEPWNGREQSVVVRVPPLGGMILKRTGTLRRPAKKTAGGAAAKKPAAKKADEKDAKPAAKATAKKAAPKKAAEKKPAAKKAAPAKGRSEKKPAAKK